jgi:hypothetical protein
MAETNLDKPRKSAVSKVQPKIAPGEESGKLRLKRV